MVPINFVDATISDLTPAPMRLPSLGWSTFALFGRARSLWRWYRYGEIYGNPKNFGHLLAGHVVGYTLGDKLFVQVAAYTLLLATRLLECAQTQAEVKENAEELWNVILGRYIQPVKEVWPKSKSQIFGCSPSTVSWWISSFKSVCSRISRVAFSILKLGGRSLELSMRIADAVDIFYMPMEMKNHSVHTSFVNAAKWLEAISSNKEELLVGLSDNQVLIERIIQQAPFTYDQLYQSVSKNLDYLEIFHGYSEGISGFTGETITGIGKRAFKGALSVLGMHAD